MAKSSKGKDQTALKKKATAVAAQRGTKIAGDGTEGVHQAFAGRYSAERRCDEQHHHRVHLELQGQYCEDDDRSDQHEHKR